MKICVLVKEVPDAAVQKRIDPSTGRMDRSGEKNLNPYDTHAIEAAMQIREGGVAEVEEIVAVTMGPESAVRALHKAVSLGRRPLRAPHRCDARRLRRRRDRLRAGPDAQARVPRPRAARPAVRRRRVLHDRRGRRRAPADALAHAGHQDGRRRRRAALRAPGRVRLRHRRAQAAGRDLRRRRDQRAALPVAQGDHGRQEEAARRAVGRRRRDRPRPGRRRALRRPLDVLEGAAPEGGGHDHRGRGHERDGRAASSPGSTRGS